LPLLELDVLAQKYRDRFAVWTVLPFSGQARFNTLPGFIITDQAFVNGGCQQVLAVILEAGRLQFSTGSVMPR
jgi:hypothetical protein